jgi:hypothetical protein
MAQTESKYQLELRRKIEERFPGCIVLKNDPNLCPGIPDLSIFFNDRWAMLEVKRSASSGSEPNQDWYIQKADHMSFAAFIYPENEREVLDDLQRAFS